MLTMTYFFIMDYDINHTLSKADKAEILKENENNKPLFVKHLKEQLRKDVTVLNLVRGWKDVKLFDLEKTRVNYQKSLIKNK